MKNLLATPVAMVVILSTLPSPLLAKAEPPDFSHPLLEQMTAIDRGDFPSDPELQEVTALLTAAISYEAGQYGDAITAFESIGSDIGREWVLDEYPVHTIEGLRGRAYYYVDKDAISTGGLVEFVMSFKQWAGAELTPDTTDHEERIRVVTQSQCNLGNDLVVAKKFEAVSVEKLGGPTDRQLMYTVAIWVGKMEEPAESAKEVAQKLQAPLEYHPYLAPFEDQIMELASWIRDGMPYQIEELTSDSLADGSRQKSFRLTSNRLHTRLVRDHYFQGLVKYLSQENRRVILPQHVSNLEHDLTRIAEIQEAEKRWGNDAWHRLLFSSPDELQTEKKRIDGLYRLIYDLHRGGLDN